jgi:uncharacterized protein with PQ loop repeat
VIEVSDIFGYIGAICISIIYMFPLYDELYGGHKDHTSKSSIMFLLVAILACISFTVYGVLRVLYPVIISNSIALAANLLIVGIKFYRYKWKKRGNIVENGVV